MSAKTLQGKLWDKESSSSDSSDSSSEDDAPAVPTTTDKKVAGGRKAWADEESSDEEVQEKRKVVSHTDKRYEQMKECIKKMKEHKKINDFAELQADYDKTFKMLDKLKSVWEQEGGPPNFFIKACADLEIFCEETHEAHKKNKEEGGPRLNENKAKAFNTLRAKIRKGNKPYEEVIAQYRSDPEKFAAGEDEDAEENSDTESSSSSGSGGKKSSSSSGSDSGSDDSDSDSSNSDSDSDSDSSSSSGTGSSSTSDSGSESWKDQEEDSDSDEDEESAREKKMLRWLITPAQQAKLTKKEEERKKKEDEGKNVKVKTTKTKVVKDKDKDKETEKAPDSKKEYTPKELMDKVSEITLTRGRRGFDKKEYITKLQNLEEHAAKQGARTQLYLLIQMISADFDNTGGAFDAMKIETWKAARDKMLRMFPLLKESYEQPPEDPMAADEVLEDDPKTHRRLEGLFVEFLERLDRELYKALLFTSDVYGTEYQDILGNFSKFLKLLMKVFLFFKEKEQRDPLAITSMLLMDQLYYRPDAINRAVFEAIRHDEDIPEEEKEQWEWPEDSAAFIAELCNFVYAGGKMRQRAESSENTDMVETAHISEQTRFQRRATLFQVYHLALHDRFDSARNLLHLGNLYDKAIESDVHLQILYNRVVAQMGLCAFRLCKIPEAHQFLQDVCMYNKMRELLAQGLSYQKGMDKTADQERNERMRQLPYHMHINQDVLETSQYICAMLLEVPNLAMENIHPDKKRTIARRFRQSLEQYDKQTYTGPPETAKDSVICAARALQNGDWSSALKYLNDLKLWDLIDPGNPANGQKIKDKIFEKIQTEALRTYLFSYASIYDAFQLDQLVKMFGLSAKNVHSVVSKMMIRDEISAFWDEDSQYVLMQPFERTPLQRLAVTLAEKGAQAVAQNELLVQQKSGDYGLAARESQTSRWDDSSAGKGGRRLGQAFGDQKGKGGKGRGKGAGNSRPVTYRGWENARAAALRGSGQRGWASNAPTRN